MTAATRCSQAREANFRRERQISFDKHDLIVKLKGKKWTVRESRKRRKISMFSVTEKASEMIKEFLKSRTEAPSIRVVMQEGG